MPRYQNVIRLLDRYFPAVLFEPIDNFTGVYTPDSGKELRDFCGKFLLPAGGPPEAAADINILKMAEKPPYSSLFPAYFAEAAQNISKGEPAEKPPAGKIYADLKKALDNHAFFHKKPPFRVPLCLQIMFSDTNIFIFFVEKDDSSRREEFGRIKAAVPVKDKMTVMERFFADVLKKGVTAYLDTGKNKFVWNNFSYFIVHDKSMFGETEPFTIYEAYEKYANKYYNLRRLGAESSYEAFEKYANEYYKLRRRLGAESSRPGEISDLAERGLIIFDSLAEELKHGRKFLREEEEKYLKKTSILTEAGNLPALDRAVKEMRENDYDVMLNKILESVHDTDSGRELIEKMKWVIIAEYNRYFKFLKYIKWYKEKYGDRPSPVPIEKIKKDLNNYMDKVLEKHGEEGGDAMEAFAGIRERGRPGEKFFALLDDDRFKAYVSDTDKVLGKTIGLSIYWASSIDAGGEGPGKFESPEDETLGTINPSFLMLIWRSLFNENDQAEKKILDCLAGAGLSRGGYLLIRPNTGSVSLQKILNFQHFDEGITEHNIKAMAEELYTAAGLAEEHPPETGEYTTIIKSYINKITRAIDIFNFYNNGLADLWYNIFIRSLAKVDKKDAKILAGLSAGKKLDELDDFLDAVYRRLKEKIDSLSGRGDPEAAFGRLRERVIKKSFFAKRNKKRRDFLTGLFNDVDLFHLSLSPEGEKCPEIDRLKEHLAAALGLEKMIEDFSGEEFADELHELFREHAKTSAADGDLRPFFHRAAKHFADNIENEKSAVHGFIVNSYTAGFRDIPSFLDYIKELYSYIRPRIYHDGLKKQIADISDHPKFLYWKYKELNTGGKYLSFDGFSARIPKIFREFLRYMS